jgi:glucose/arabinose dehydrogenase/PKD repeat protein
MLGKLGRTTQPDRARSIAGERRRDASRPGDGTAPGRSRRARGERQGRLAAACPPAHRPRHRARIWLLAAAAALTAVFVAPTAASAATLPPGFQEQTVFSGLTNPTAVRFAPDGHIFVAEKRGVIKVFDSLSDTTPDVFADLNVNVYNFWDRGLLGLALAPNFPTDPHVYVLYTYDHELGSTAPAPRWGTPGVYSDPCPTPPGATADGCVVSGRLSRLQANGNTMTGSEQVLIEDWCQQYPSHSIGALAFGPDGALYASGGDGASFNFADWGQDGTPLNPCGDPPGGVGATLAPPTAEGGALRSQDLRTSGDPVTLDGTLIRVDPATGAGLPDNPLASNSDPNARRIIASGMRNPFRFAARPGTSEVWIGDVGWNTWEEINRVASPTDATVDNFGWPCYEGNGRQSGYDAANLTLCENLYNQAGAVTAPYFTYNHSALVVPNESCPTGSSSVAGIAFGPTNGNYPSEYHGALFFADYSRDCIWAMPLGLDGNPAPGQIRTFVAGAANPVELQIGPGGDLFYPDFDGGSIRRVIFTPANQPPIAVATATPTTGSAPLTVQFDGSGSSDPDAGDTLTYAWDLDADGQYDDSTAVAPTYTYTNQGVYAASLRVTDNHGDSGTAAVTITVGNTAPTAIIDAPAATTTWKVGDFINFSGHATDAQDGTLPASALTWQLILQHCPSNCHTHPLQDFTGVASGSFTAPDHEYPSYLELKLTATDSGGLTDTKTIRLDPKTVTLTFSSIPGGLRLAVGGTEGTASFTRTVIQGSTNTISAVSPQTKGKRSYAFTSWSDGGAQTHTITAPTVNTTYTARFRAG